MGLIVVTFLGSAVGGVSRHWISDWIGRRQSGRFPVGTLIVNVSGAFLIGLVWAWPETAATPAAQLARDGAMVGLLGGYTTVSSFTLQTLHLFHERQHRTAVANVASSFFLCLLAVAAGVAAGSGLGAHWIAFAAAH